MPFYIAYADATGSKVAASEYMLPIAPTDVDYPEDAAGILLETSDGSVVQQQPNKDSRRRQWRWVGYRNEVVGYSTMWEKLEGLRSRTRIEAGALTPYVFVKDTITKKLRRRVSVKGTASTGSASTLTDSTGTWTTDQWANLRIQILDGTGVGQDRVVASNTGTTVTVATNFTVAPDNTSKYEIYGWAYDWQRVRVVDVSRTNPRDGGQVRYPESRFVFVIDDPNFTDIG